MIGKPGDLMRCQPSGLLARCKDDGKLRRCFDKVGCGLCTTLQYHISGPLTVGLINSITGECIDIDTSAGPAWDGVVTRFYYNLPFGCAWRFQAGSEYSWGGYSLWYASIACALGQPYWTMIIRAEWVGGGGATLDQYFLKRSGYTPAGNYYAINDATYQEIECPQVQPMVVS